MTRATIALCLVLAANAASAQNLLENSGFHGRMRWA